MKLAHCAMCSVQCAMCSLKFFSVRLCSARLCSADSEETRAAAARADNGSGASAHRGGRGEDPHTGEGRPQSLFYFVPQENLTGKQAAGLATQGRTGGEGERILISD